MSFFAAQQTSLFDSSKVSSNSEFNFYEGDQVSLLNGSPDSLYEIVNLDGESVTLRSLASGSKRIAPRWLIRPACGIEGRGDTLAVNSEHTVLSSEHTVLSSEHRAIEVVLEQPDICDVATRISAPEQTAPEQTAPEQIITEKRSHLICDVATPTSATSQSARLQIHWVETYSPANRKQYSYYRYMWMSGRKLHHIHIKGGDVANPKAIALKEKVESAIARGETPTQIQLILKSR